MAFDPADPNVLARLTQTTSRTRSAPNPSSPVPFQGGWLVALSYELGRAIEPTAAVHPARVDERWPWPIVLWRCPWAFAFDHDRRQWWIVQSDAAASVPDPSPWNVPPDAPPFRLGIADSARSRGQYLAAVRRAVECIHAGDCFQVNLAHRINASFEGSARALFHSLLGAAAPWYGAYLELPHGPRFHAALSASPELFLRYDGASRMITTRPIKGTRTTEAGAAALHASAKDRAELNMIIDLMRSDLGRVCDLGSVRVAEARAIETHASVVPDSKSRGRQSDPLVVAPGLHHGVATIAGRVRENASIADILRATFPGGSITGAPKVRAMQIIEELEPAPRGLYTGAIGFISDSGDIALNIAIRTAVVHGTPTPNSSALDDVSDGTLAYGVGAGIVADSIPEQEWQETLDKAGVLRNLPTDSTVVRRAPRPVAHGARA
ncbi:MAG TPA: anthranilate synthase component I family protein [Phycisphaerales bacterium]|nr:anthranilate synthase component I family protein [Phycisphaerales bacterium]